MLKSTFCGLTVLSLTIRVGSIFCLAVAGSKICEIQQNSRRISTYSRSRSSNVIDLGVSGKRICDLQLLVAISLIVTLDVSPTVFDILMCKAAKGLFFPPLPCLMPPSGGIPCTINIIYTLLKITFSALQFCRRHCGLSSFV